eukprot:10501670-Prorocentrum_lima.AAC.1
MVVEDSVPALKPKEINEFLGFLASFIDLRGVKVKSSASRTSVRDLELLKYKHINPEIVHV